MVIMSITSLKKTQSPITAWGSNKQIIDHQKKGGEGDASIHHQTH